MNFREVNKTYYSKELPYIRSVKPYFFTSHSRKSSINSSIGIQWGKMRTKRLPSMTPAVFQYPSLSNSIFLKKLTSRPGSPITFSNKSLDYIPSSKKKKSENSRQKSTLKKILLSQKHPEKQKIEIQAQNTLQTRVLEKKTKRSPIKLTKSPQLFECPSHVSIDYILPRYKT